MSKAPPKKLGTWTPGWLRSQRPGADVPSDIEIQKAVRHFRLREPFCRLEGISGNEGFGVSLSFEPVTYQSGGDFIEVALRRASLRFKPVREAGWRWADALKEFLGRAADSYVIRRTSGASGTQTAEVGGRTEVFAEGESGVPLLKGKAGGKLGLDAKRSGSRTSSSGTEITRTVTERWAQITRPAGEFELSLGSPAQDDLVRFNAELDRIGVLACDEPSSVTVNDVSVTLSMREKDEGEHALRIRDVGGSWQRLTEHRNKAVISEIFVSKFLKPAHQPLRLWPRKTP